MSGTATLLQLRTTVRERCDMTNASGVYTNSFVTDSELNQYINNSYFELYDLLVQKYGDDYYVASPYQFTTDGSSQLYALPADFYKLLGVDLSLSNSPNSWITIRPFMFPNRNDYSVPNFASFYGVTNLRYRLQGANLWLNPIPTGGQNMQIWYVPRMTELAADGDVCDGVSGWTEYIIVDAAIKCLAKEESDTSVFMAQKQGLIQRIEAAAENRDAGNPQTVCDVRRYDDGVFPNGNGFAGGGGY